MRLCLLFVACDGEYGGGEEEEVNVLFMSGSIPQTGLMLFYPGYEPWKGCTWEMPWIGTFQNTRSRKNWQKCWTEWGRQHLLLSQIPTMSKSWNTTRKDGVNSKLFHFSHHWKYTVPSAQVWNRGKKKPRSVKSRQTKCQCILPTMCISGLLCAFCLRRLGILWRLGR